jgi:NodT family efflux transporter outer membrane factor (OMF) lipoprotein
MVSHLTARSNSVSVRPVWLFAGAAALACLAGCAVGPDYRRPAIATPVAFKENTGWKTATPNDAAARAPWWEAFQDPLLNELESQVSVSNLTLAQAVANYEVSRQLARSDRTAFLPEVSAVGSGNRSKTAAGKNSSSATSSNYSGSLQASWEPDIWGRVRRLTEGDVATAQASAAQLAAVRLSLQTTFAQDYIALRAVDEKKQLLTDAVAAYGRTLKISQNRYSVGVVSKSGVLSAQTQLDSARAQLVDVGVLRTQLEHALAVLLGKFPAEFSVESRPGLDVVAPEIPLLLPSDLLERRPDVAQAERETAAANARVGVQTAAYFPALSLSGAAGYTGSPLNNLFSAPFRFWSLGAEVSDALLDWGQRHDQVLAARATYDGNVANYRQVVLTAFEQVEDNLAELRILREESDIQDAAVSEAAEAARIALNEYNAGTVDYTTVLTAQVTELTNRETALSVHQSRLTSSVALIGALGGGWSAADLPTSGQVYARHQENPATSGPAK